MSGSPKKRERRERWEAWKAEPEAIEELCDYIAEGLSLLSWTKLKDFGYNTVADWIDADAARSAKYARAKAVAADVLAEEIIAIADDSRNDTQVEDGKTIVNHDHIQRSKLRVESRRWYAAKIAPRKYGDRIQQDVTGTLTIEDALKQLPPA